MSTNSTAYKCPHCGKTTVVNEESWDERLMENLPSNLLKASLVTLAGALTGGVGGVVLGGVFYGGSIVKFFNGKTVTCRNPQCGEEFSI